MQGVALSEEGGVPQTSEGRNAADGPFSAAYLQLLQDLALQLLQSLPDDEVNLPPTLLPKRENFFSTLRLRHSGQLVRDWEFARIRSNSAPHLLQLNS